MRYHKDYRVLSVWVKPFRGRDAAVDEIGACTEDDEHLRGVYIPVFASLKSKSRDILEEVWEGALSKVRPVRMSRTKFYEDLVSSQWKERETRCARTEMAYDSQTCPTLSTREDHIVDQMEGRRIRPAKMREG